MEIYILTLLLIFVFGTLDLLYKLSNKIRYFGIGIIYVIIVLQIGLRWETGTDWKPYLENFETTDNFNRVLINIISGFEIGYGTIVLLFKNVIDNYSVFLLIHAIFFYSIIFKTANKYSPYLFISLIFFYSTNLGIVGSNRQLLAIAICLLSLPYVIQRKPFKFFAIVFIASLFHNTAFLFGFYYFLNKNINAKIAISVLILAFVIGKTNLPIMFFSKLGNIFGEVITSKTNAYSESAKDKLAEANLSIFGLVRRLFYITVFTYNYKIIARKISYYKLLYNGYLFGMIIYFLFSSSLLILINRGSLYFNIMESLLISCQFLIFKKNTDRAIVFGVLFLLSILLMYQSISGYHDLFDPYKSLFYNYDFYREMY